VRFEFRPRRGRGELLSSEVTRCQDYLFYPPLSYCTYWKICSPSKEGTKVVSGLRFEALRLR
jgi:hypothetical protein